MPRNRFRPTPELTRRVDAWFVEAANRVKGDILGEWDAFHGVNDHFKTLVTDRQMREVSAGAQRSQ